MKVLISVSSYYPSLDGVSYVTQYIAEGLVKKNWDVTVITSNNRKPKFELHNKVKIYRINTYTFKTFHFGDKQKYLHFIKSFSKDKFIFINVGIQNSFTDWTLKYIKNKNFFSILYLHGIYSSLFNKNDFINLNNFFSKIFRNIRWYLYVRFIKRYFQKYNLIIHLHKKDQSIDFFKRLGFKKKLVLENAVEKKFFNLKKIKNKKFTFISINSFNYRKNQILIMKSFVNANIDNSLLILVGNNGKKYYELLLKEKKKYQNKKIYKNIKIFYELPREKSIKLLINSDVFLMASTWEAYPISILESLSCGIPFISTKVGILSNLPGGVIIKNSQEMTHIMIKMFREKNFRKKLSLEGKKYAKKCFHIEDKIKVLDSKLKQIKKKQI